MSTFPKPFDLTGKTAVVTGASKGIGEAMVRIYAQAGANVVISSRNQNDIDDIANDLKKDGLEATGIAANIGRPEDETNLINKTVELYGSIDIFVNNAATNPVYGPMVTVEDDIWDKIMDVNVKAIFRMGKQLLPLMKDKGGSIINVSSVGGLTPEPGIGIYSISKAALVNLTKLMAKEWGENNIRANIICPGLIQTKFSKALWSNETIKNNLLKDVPLDRIGSSEELAGLALLLASDAGSYMTGGVYVCDGGSTT